MSKGIKKSLKGQIIVHDIKSYDSFQADRVEGSKGTYKNMIYDILKLGILPNEIKLTY